MPCGIQALFYAKTAIKWEIVTAKARITANKAGLFKRSVAGEGYGPIGN
jgi:hypothetical protein